MSANPHPERGRSRSPIRAQVAEVNLGNDTPPTVPSFDGRISPFSQHREHFGGGLVNHEESAVNQAGQARPTGEGNAVATQGVPLSDPLSNSTDTHGTFDAAVVVAEELRAVRMSRQSPTVHIDFPYGVQVHISISVATNLEGRDGAHVGPWCGQA